MSCNPETTPENQTSTASTAPAEEVKVKTEEEDPKKDETESGYGSDHEAELVEEDELRANVKKSREKYGIEDPRTVNHVLALVSNLICQYKLNDTEMFINEIMPACKKIGGDTYFKAIQSKSFCFYKQYRYKEAIELFLEQEKLTPPSAALCENMGHTYNTMGNYEKADEYFSKALKLLESGSYGNKGGVLMGLGLVRERLGKPQEALPILKLSLAHYQKQFTGPDGKETEASLVAKAHMSVAQCHETLGDLEDAEAHTREALRIFLKTVGWSSPLTANTLGTMGRILKAQKKNGLAEMALKEALALEVKKDAFHLDTVWRLLNHIKELREADSKKEGGITWQEQKTACEPYVLAMQEALRRIKQLNLDNNPDVQGPLAMFYNMAYEICTMADRTSVDPPEKTALDEAMEQAKKGKTGDDDDDDDEEEKEEESESEGEEKKHTTPQKVEVKEEKKEEEDVAAAEPEKKAEVEVEVKKEEEEEKKKE